MNTFYYLKSCDTCKRIMKELGDMSQCQLHEIKSNPLTTLLIDELAKKAGSYEAIFNKRAQLLKLKNVKVNSLTESDYRSLLLEHYSFLKRPLLETQDTIVAGNSTVDVAKMKDLS